MCSIKTDGRLYCANLRNEANGNGDVNQAALVTPKGKWVDFRIKASDFILTSRGLINTERFRMNLREVKTFGIALMDMENGTQPELDLSALPRTSEEEMQSSTGTRCRATLESVACSKLQCAPA